MRSCCGLDAVWVDNVPGKEYWYCKECRNEVKDEVSMELETDESGAWWMERYGYKSVFDSNDPSDARDLTQQEIDDLLSDWPKLP